jgi:hypothetical protein
MQISLKCFRGSGHRDEYPLTSFFVHVAMARGRRHDVQANRLRECYQLPRTFDIDIDN